MTTERRRAVEEVEAAIAACVDYTRELMNDRFSEFVRYQFDGEKLTVTNIPREQVYFDTTPTTADELAEYMAVAIEQNDLVMDIFRVAGRPLIPWEVWRMGGERSWLLPSVRRSITVLTKAGALVKLDTLRPGPYRNRSHEWALPEHAGTEVKA